ncbi:hypothetical protein BGX34_007212 [Mortierella sp. NVP85]|nr:hypothetical protein BGX34_007212 [Mortierella sp. NVP85]
MDPDDINAQQWQGSLEKEDRSPSSPYCGPCNDYWFIPTYVDKPTLLNQLYTIQGDTLAHLEYNREYEKHEQKQKTRRTKGWAKPDRELTDVEKKKKKKQDELEKERTRYLGKPTEECAFVHRIKWPLERPPYFWLHTDLQLLDSLRAECRAFIWLEQEKVIYVAGDDKDTTFTAMYRIKNILIKLLTPFTEEVNHILETPSRLVEIIMDPTPPAKFLEANDNSSQESNIPPMFIRAKELGGFGNLVDFDLRMASFDNMETGSAAHDKTSTLKYTESLGQVCLIEYPKTMVFSVRELDESVIIDPRLKSKFSPYFTPSPEIYRALLKRFEPRDRYENNVQTEIRWDLGILRRGEGEKAEKGIRIDLEVWFSEDGNISLWNSLISKATPMDIRVISSEKRFSWAWTITTAKQLGIDKFSTEGDFVHKLYLQDGKLVFSNTMDVQLRFIKRVKTTLFINDPWTTELVEESFWTLYTPYMPHQSVTLTGDPDKVLYSVSMFRDSWKTRFSEMPSLTIGKLPTWDYTDFVDGAESIQRTMEAVEDVRAKLESLY